MARIKNINTRIQLKNDTEINWNKAKAEEGKDGFIPLLGEAIVYMGENGHGPRIKIGDGETNVTELPFLEDNDTVYTADKGIEITAENIIQHINNLDAPPSEIGFYKIKYDQQGHINGATVVNKQDILNLLQMTPGRIDSVQITAEAPLVSSDSAENTTNLVTNISFSQQNQNTVLAGPTQSATGAPSFRQLEASDIPNLDASKITTGTFPESQIGNLSASKITSDTFNEDRIPTLGPNKISGVIPVSKGGTGVDGVNGNLENNITRFFNNGIFAYDSTNARFKQFGITALGNTDTFTDYINSLNGATGNLIVDLNTLIKAIPPINLNNPRDITENYTNSYYAPKTKGYENSVLISQGKENNNEGTEPIWLNPTALSAEGFHGGALFYGRYSREVERIVDNETVTYTDTGFETQWGTLPVEQGGTGVTNFDDNCVLIGSGENPIRTIAKTSLLSQDQNKNTIVERDTNGDFATRIITLSVGTGGLKNNSTETNNQQIISINNSGISTHYGNLMADNLIATIGTIKMSKFNANNVSEQPIIEWYKKESKNDSLVNVKVGELYWDYNKSNRGMLRNYYSTINGEIYSDSYYLPAVDTSSANNNIFTLLATDSISNMFPSNSILYSNGEVNKITYKESANGALYSTSVNGSLEWGTLPVAQGGTGFTTTTNVNAVVIGNSTLATGTLQTIATANGAFFATGNNSKPQFGILPVAQGGTGVTSIENIQAGKDGDGNTISSTYLKLSGGTLNGNLTISHATNDTMTADSTNPKITFSESGNQPVHLIYTDYDNYRSPAGLKIVGGTSANPAWFEVEGQVYAAGFNGPLTGNAATATKLSTACNINGTSFDGSAAITTANWGTARNITIKDASSTNAGTAVSVNGSSAITLLLPSTIKASITGNATSATKATQDSDGNTITSTYLKLSGGTLTGNLNLKTSSANSPDIVWWYGNTNKEQARFWMDSGFSSKGAPHFREYNSDGTSLYDGYLPLGDGTGASGTWGINISGNADKVDGYHASDLWRKDGGTWNPNTNITLGATDNNQEWSFDISRNNKTGCYWQIWDSSHGTLLKVNADDGKVSAPKNFVGTLEGDITGNAATATLSPRLSSSGFQEGCLSYYQADDTFFGSTSGWEHFIICNHGNGSTYYNYTIGLPFYGVPQYKRQTGSTSSTAGWYDFLTTEKTVTVAQGGTGVTSISNIKAGKDGDGNTISSTYLKLSGGTLTGDLSINKNLFTLSLINDKSSGNHGLKSNGYGQGNEWSTWTEDEAWLIYRNANGNIIVNGNCTGSAGSVTWGNVSGKPGNYPGGCTGNAATATGVKDAGNSSRTITIRYGGDGASASDWIPMHDNNGNLVPVSSTNLANKIRDKASGSWNISITGFAGSVVWGNIVNKPTSYQIFGGGNFYESTNKQWTNAGDHVWLDSGTLDYTIPAGRYFICASCYVHQNTGSGVVKVRFNQSSNYQLEEIVSDGAVMNSSGITVVITGCLLLPNTTRAQIILNANGAGYTITGFSYFSNRLTLIPIN